VVEKIATTRGVEMLYQDRHPYAGGSDAYAGFFEVRTG
jgi:hypothetical protein